VSATAIGWFGKLPSHGDFLKRRVPDAFGEVWDTWLQESIAASRQHLNDAWLSAYLTSPVWRFFISDGVAGAASFAGIMLPSVDRVGRYFPLTIFAELPAALPPMAIAIYGREWLRQIEDVALTALESEELDVEKFDLALGATASELSLVEQYRAFDAGQEFPAANRHWRIPVDSIDRMPAALIDPLMQQLGRQLRPLTMWWTNGSERVGACCLLCERLPTPERYIAMLDGGWAVTGWQGELANEVREEQEEDSLTESPRLQLSSAAICDIGPARKINQDRIVDRLDAGLWAVADGMGGHARGEVASQITVDVLGSVPPAATVSAAIETARQGLIRANDELRRAAAQLSPGQSIGSTIVVLCIRQAEWAVLWAGDSRAYLLREGVLSALTQDHSTATVEEEFDPIAPPQSTGAITRAVGGEDELLLDHAAGFVSAGDRFLICSDGVHGSIAHAELTNMLSKAKTPEQAVAELLAISIERGSTDNISAVVIDVSAQDDIE
jgi:type VI secretion system protein ImpM